MELQILGLMAKTREAYELVREACAADWNTTFSPLGRVAADLLADFYNRDKDAGACPKEVLIERGNQKFATSKHAETFADFVSGFDGAGSLSNIVFDIRQQRRNRVGDELAGLLANRDKSGKVDSLIQTYQELGESDVSTTDGETFCNVSVGDLFAKHFSDEGTIPFGLGALDRYTNGGARPGHHILVFARPEIGKSLVCVDLTARWVGAGRRVLYVENEEPLADTTARLIQRICRRTRDDVQRDYRGCQEALEQGGYSNYIGASLSPGNYAQIGALVDRHEPDIVVINQLRNIDVGDDNRVTALEKAAIGGRNLAKSRGVIVTSVTQAGDSATGKQFLELNDVDSSKTGIPGAIDLAIGIGASDEDIRFGIRHVNLPKNKLGGQHGHFQIKVFPQTGVIETIN